MSSGSLIISIRGDYIRQFQQTRGQIVKRLIICLLAIFILAPTVGSAQVTYVVYSVGENRAILELVSGQWQSVDAGDMTGCGDLLEIWGSSGNDIYVTGCGSQILHYNGLAWERITIPDATLYYSDIFYTVNGTSPNNIYIAGRENTGVDNIGVAYRFNGSTWNYIGGHGWMRKLWADPGGGLYALSSVIDFTQLGDPSYHIVARYENGQWTTDRMPTYDNLYDDKYYDIAGFMAGYPFMSGYVDWVPSAPNGGFISRKLTYWNDIYYGVGCDEDFWPYFCPTWPVRFYGIWGASDTDIWFAGENGSVMHWTPTGYTEYDTGVTQTLRSIWGSSGTDVYAVGDYGKIVHFNGSSWKKMPSETTENLTDVWGLFELPVATLLQSFSTDAEASHVTIRWSLSEIDEGAEFRVSRMTDASTVFMIDSDADIYRDGLSFEYSDDDVEPGREYAYLVEYSSGDGWITLIETSPIAVPGVSLALMPNYPNPFNPSTRIDYSIAESGNVSLKIYDASGRLIRTLVDEAQAPGKYSEHWNGMNNQGRPAASGTYFCRLVTAKQAEMRKMLLMR